MNNLDGFLVIDKNPGMSSYDIIRRLKRLHRFKKIGYIGTLDRNATGVLPVAMDEGVKLIPFLEDVEKVYEADFLLGMTTDTYDVEGKILSETVVEPFEFPVIDNALKPFLGKITQQIPMYSSKKLNRKPLYKYAREGIEVEPQTKEVEIFQIRITDYTHPHIRLEITCSKGTYIRAVANDLGRTLECGATLFSLKRTRHGEFTETMSVNIDSFKTEQDLLNYTISLDKVPGSMPAFVVEVALERFLRQGMPIPLLGEGKDWRQGTLIRLFSKKGLMIGIGMVDAASRTVKVKRLINM